jgi:hypothetical protein
MFLNLGLGLTALDAENRMVCKLVVIDECSMISASKLVQIHDEKSIYYVGTGGTKGTTKNWGFGAIDT